MSLSYTTDTGTLIITSGSHRATLTGVTDVTGLTADNFVFDPDGYVRLTDNNPSGTATIGNYKILGGAGDNRLTGGSKNDDISGGDGNDEINGGNGDDTIAGGNGNDVIQGGAGADSLDGGENDGDSDTLSYAGSPSGPTTGDDANPRNGVTVTLNSAPTVDDNTRTHAEGDTSITGSKTSPAPATTTCSPATVEPMSSKAVAATI